VISADVEQGQQYALDLYPCCVAVRMLSESRGFGDVCDQASSSEGLGLTSVKAPLTKFPVSLDNFLT